MAVPDAPSRKITVSIPADLVSYADMLASQNGTTRSAIICDLLAERLARERDELAREGYAFYGREAEEFAAATSGAVAEALDDERPSR